MSSTEAQQLYGQGHVRRYRENEMWPHYDEYATRTERVIPVVVLERI